MPAVRQAEQQPDLVEREAERLCAPDEQQPCQLVPSVAAHAAVFARRRLQKSDTLMHIAIVGAGSGAFAAAIEAADQGARVTMIEAETLGGTCVNVGCVPSKIMIRAAHVAHTHAWRPFAGIAGRTPEIDRAALVAQQQHRVCELRFAKYQSIVDTRPAIDVVKGRARFKNSKTLIVTRHEREESELCADRLLIATGRRPNTAGINLQSIGVRLSEGGAVHVDDHLRTTIPDVYAVGPAGHCTVVPLIITAALSLQYSHARIARVGGHDPGHAALGQDYESCPIYRRVRSGRSSTNNVSASRR
jgi:pyruvate/2-oxoglutarate dehydrogenase complex dihydrolipoamide dehydrogenase (E3) component